MPFQPGQSAGDYEVLDVIGKGGMGRVYRVRNVISDRIEAMKVLLDDIDSEPGVEDRFIAEIRTLARLDHPNIAKLHTAFKLDRQLLMVMEFVEGTDLSNWAKQSPIPINKVIAYLQQVLSGLAYAHKHGVVHRDIKPSNIMLTSDETAKLMDFGIAKSNAEPFLTKPGTTLGSLLYMSPEQVRGTPVDSRSDLYSLGVVLYQLTAGRCPFEAESTYKILDAQLNAAPPPPIEINPSLPPALNEIILTALQKDPAKRFQNAEAFRKVLETVVAGDVAGQTQPMHPPQSAARPSAGSSFVMAGATQTATPSGSPPVKASPALPMPSGRHSIRGRRSLWMAAGAAACLCVLGAAVIAVPHFRTSSAASTPTAFQQPAASPHKSNPVPVSGSTPGSAAVTPATDTPAPIAHTDTGTLSDRGAAHSQDHQDQRHATANPKHEVPTRDSQTPAAIARPAESAPTIPPAAPAGPSEADLKNADEALMKVHARADAVHASLASLKQAQMSQGLGLRGDMVASEARMESYLQVADRSLQNRDLESAQRNTDRAEEELIKLERFLGR